MKYWIASAIVTAIFAIALFTITKYFWVFSILVMGFYTGIGISFRIADETGAGEDGDSNLPDKG